MKIFVDRLKRWNYGAGMSGLYMAVTGAGKQLVVRRKQPADMPRFWRCKDEQGQPWIFHDDQLTRLKRRNSKKCECK